MRRCRVKTGRISTGSTWGGDGDWIEHYADTHCDADLVRGKCPSHSRKKAAARSAPKKRRSPPEQKASK